MMPARDIIIKSDIYKEKRASYGTILANRLWYVLPPTSDVVYVNGVKPSETTLHISLKNNAY